MKVLVIITTQLVEFGGIANAFMNYYRSMDLAGLQIDVISCSNHDEGMAKEIEINGGKVFDVPSKQKEPIKYYYAVNKIMQNGYDVVDVHGNSATMVMEMFLAKKNGVNNRMAHCLNSKTNHPLIHKVLRPLFNSFCNTKTACTNESGKYLYGKDEYIVLRNTIPLSKYVFSEEKRKKIREHYGIDDGVILVGTVGKINRQKNQLFFLDVLKDLIQHHKNIKFLIVGDGSLRTELEEKVKEFGLTEYVILAGMQSDVVAYYSAFDIYVFPSIFEGESLALLEAKSSGVLGCASSLIKTSDDDGSDNIVYIDLNTEKWVNHIEKCINRLGTQDRHKDSAIAIAKIKDKGIDSVDGAKILKSLYVKG